MNISIFGLGYVGCVSLGCLASLNHKVIGVDIILKKIELINSKKATVVEKHIDNLIAEGVDNQKIIATLEAKEAILNSDVAILCVGTPNNNHGQLDMTYIYKVAAEIGVYLKEKSTFFTIAIRSTVMPGTNKKVAEIIAEKSDKTINVDFAVVSNPEFLREGSAVKDFMNPPYTVIGTTSAKAVEVMKQMYEAIPAEIVVSQIEVAELIKFVSNSYHALKVVFANEVGRICKSLNVDSHSLMNLFVKDTILNTSGRYLKPGFAYGGSCLPKDLKALNTIAHDNYLSVPVLAAVDESNQRHLEYAMQLILEKQKKKIGLYGIAFKEGTDDLRFSPGLALAERFIGKGLDVKVYDKNINLSKLLGKNKTFLFQKLPHINSILVDNLADFLKDLEVLILINKDEEIHRIENFLKKQTIIIDLARIDQPKEHDLYEGICW